MSFIIDAIPPDLHRLIESEGFYQVTSFTSKDLANLPDQSVINALPCVIHNFGESKSKVWNNSSENALKTMYTLQESLIIFYTSVLNEIKPFVDHLIPQLSVRQRPKCLIIHLSNSSSSSDETDAIDALKNAWGKKFLDFTIMRTDYIDEILSFYYLNPFNDIVYRKYFQNQSREIFPDKLIYGYVDMDIHFILQLAFHRMLNFLSSRMKKFV